MNSLLKSPSNSSRPRAAAKASFTLVELLVAITILLVIIVLFGQMLAITNKVWIYGHGRANNFTKARAMLELIAQDIQSGVFRPDLADFPSGSSGTGGTPPSWEFYTARPGIPAPSSGSLRSISVVQYTFIGPINSYSGIPNTLERADCPVLMTNAPTYLLFGSTNSFTPTPTGTPKLNPRDTASGVIAFEVVFVQADGTFSTTFTPVTYAGVTNPNPTRAVSITLAVIDDLNIAKLNNGQLMTLNSNLTSAIPGTITASIKSYWDTYLNGYNWTGNGYPKGFGASLATFERYVSLPTSP